MSLLLGAAFAQSAFGANVVTVQQGGVGRWAGIAAKECGIYGKRYKAVDAVCYYPVDIQTTPGTHEIALWDQDGKQHLGTLKVQKADFPNVDMPLPEKLDRFLHVSQEDSERASKERGSIAKVLGGGSDDPRFSLPLGAPAAKLPKSEDDFGSERRFDQDHLSLHSGRDYPVGLGNPVKAIAAGTVVLAADHFFAGNSVFIDHGDGLVSMYFHLQSIAVKDGDTVKRGQRIGKIGGTGRATGPHLHLGLRWLGKRIDPALLLAKPTALPSVSDSKDEAQHKIEKAEHREPAEKDAPVVDDES
ncbi:MAG: M23 family metallopeptidase [Dokdonella sp.]|uniref:M23 family metallopeptidase n=1 Tax=Dokdonella sp. TaxID=2291710 RepID=UPI003264952E